MRGYTVEMSFLMPVVLLLIMGSIFGMFYYHDKNIISGAAYETAAVGGTKAREKSRAAKEDFQTLEGELGALFKERVRGKCILFGRITVTVSVREDRIRVQGKASKRGMTVSVEKSMRITDPEKKIRDIRRLK